MKERINAVINFWFLESSMSNWFSKDKIFDKKIKDLFEKDYIKAINNELEDWQEKPKGCLALIILLDQFSRNLNRNHQNAFKYDDKTRLIVNESIDRGDLEKFNNNEILFFLMPLIHSETISDHIFAHNLRKVYLIKHPKHADIKKTWDDHTYVIRKFNRYPHRNKILGRESSVKEMEFLSNENYSW